MGETFFSDSGDFFGSFDDHDGGGEENIPARMRAPTEDTFDSRQSTATSNTERTDDLRQNRPDSPWRVVNKEKPVDRPQVTSVALDPNSEFVVFATEKGYNIRQLEIHSSPSAQPSTNFVDELSSDTSKIQKTSHYCIRKTSVKGGVLCCQYLPSRSLLAIAKSNSPRCLSLTPLENHNNVSSSSSFPRRQHLYFVAAVRRVDMNERCLVVLSADGKIHVFEMESLNLIKTVTVLASSIRPKEPAAYAFYSVSKHPEECWLACRSIDRQGNVVVYNASDGMKKMSTVNAHESCIASIAIGGKQGAQRMATADQLGTMIHVFSLPNGQPLYTLRRGLNSCKVFSMAFNQSATKIAVSGSSKTVHIFRVTDEKDQPKGLKEKIMAELAECSQRGLAYMFPKVSGGSSGSNNNNSTEKKEGESHLIRSYAKVKLRLGKPIPDNSIALKEVGNDEEVLTVCTPNASLLQFSVSSNGNVCNLLLEDALIDD